MVINMVQKYKIILSLLLVFTFLFSFTTAGKYDLTITGGNNIYIINESELFHNNLTDLQGGASNEYYHIRQTWYDHLSSNLFDFITNSVNDLVNYYPKTQIDNLLISIGNFSDWDKSYDDLINKPVNLSEFNNDLNIGNWTNDKSDYYTSSEIDAFEYTTNASALEYVNASGLFYSITNPFNFFNVTGNDWLYSVGNTIYFNESLLPDETDPYSYHKDENINATGYNITADYFFGDISQATGVSSPDLTNYSLNNGSKVLIRINNTSPTGATLATGCVADLQSYGKLKSISIQKEVTGVAGTAKYLFFKVTTEQLRQLRNNEVYFDMYAPNYGSSNVGHGTVYFLLADNSNQIAAWVSASSSGSATVNAGFVRVFDDMSSFNVQTSIGAYTEAFVLKNKGIASSLDFQVDSGASVGAIIPKGNYDYIIDLR
jgi:hypothetical protein